MSSKISTHPRLDPRIKAMLGAMPSTNPGDAENREQVLAEATSDVAANVATRERSAFPNSGENSARAKIAPGNRKMFLNQ